tara:strand:+ start:661 stop:951 length:291 start_codon:yes stop_codon:yes gene_type:complete
MVVNILTMQKLLDKLEDKYDFNYDIKNIIIKIIAVNNIQKIVKKKFVKKYGKNWKETIKYKNKLLEIDSYYERIGIYDPWYDYCDDIEYIKKQLNL